MGEGVEGDGGRMGGDEREWEGSEGNGGGGMGQAQTGWGRGMAGDGNLPIIPANTGANGNFAPTL